MKQDYTITRNQLDGVEALLRVAERRNFRAAARDLGVSPSAVSQTIRALEARIGVALLTRTTRSVGLTQAGQIFLDRARPAFDDLVAAYDAARNLGDRPAGLLRINTPRASIPFLIEPILPDFLAAHPDVQVEIFAEDAFVDLAQGGYDAGIRLGEYLQADMVAVRLSSPFRFVVVGSPEYLDKHGRPEKPGDLREHDCVRLRMGSGGLPPWEFVDGNRQLSVAVHGPAVVNDAWANVGLTLRGVGLSYEAEPLIAQHVLNGRLEIVLESYAPTSPGMFLYYPSRTQVLPKLRAFIDYFKANPPLEARLFGKRS